MSVRSEEEERRAYHGGMSLNHGRKISGDEGSGSAKIDAQRAAVPGERTSMGRENMGDVYGGEKNDEGG